MKNPFKGIGGLLARCWKLLVGVLLLVGAYMAARKASKHLGKAEVHKSRAESLENLNQTKKIVKQIDQNRTKAIDHLDKAAAAKKKVEQKIANAGDKDETLADVIDRYNRDRVRANTPR